MHEIRNVGVLWNAPKRASGGCKAHGPSDADALDAFFGAFFSMNFLNIPISATIRSPEFIGCEPADRATWICLLSFCCEHDTSGRIENCLDWGDRRWMQSCAITTAEVKRECALWKWEGNSLVVFGYPHNVQHRIESQRDAAYKTNHRRWGYKRVAKRLGKRVASLPFPSLSTEGGAGETKTGVNGHFKKPTPQELELHSAKIGLPSTEATKFFNWYESNGWKVGKNPMRCWRSAMTGWKVRWEESRSPLPRQTSIPNI